MNDKKLQSYLSMSSIIGYFICFITLLITDTFNKEIYNYISVGVCSIIPFIVFVICIIIYLYNRSNLNIKKMIIFAIIYLLCSFIVGYLIEWLLIDKLLNKDIVNIVRVVNALYQPFIGVVVSFNYSYDFYKKLVK